MNEEFSPAIETHPFEPFVPQNARALFLGTFPPKPERWSMDFFYPNRINDMWRIFGIIFFRQKDYFWNDEKKAFRLQLIIDFLNLKGIALFDTAMEVRRLKDNASDKFLEIVKPIALESMLDSCPSIGSVVTTGEKAASVIAEITGSPLPKMGQSIECDCGKHHLTHFRMPSSSRAYPMNIEKKAEIYRGMFAQIGLLD